MLETEVADAITDLDVDLADERIAELETIREANAQLPEPFAVLDAWSTDSQLDDVNFDLDQA